VKLRQFFLFLRKIHENGLDWGDQIGKSDWTNDHAADREENLYGVGGSDISIADSKQGNSSPVKRIEVLF